MMLVTGSCPCGRRAVFRFATLAMIILVSIVSMFGTSNAIAQQLRVANWQARLLIPDTGLTIDFGLRHSRDADSGQSIWSIVNGPETIQIPTSEFVDEQLILQFPHYDSSITIDISQETFDSSIPTDLNLEGTFRKRRGNDEWVELKLAATPAFRDSEGEPSVFAGRWRVNFSSSEDPAVGIFEAADDNKVYGTFLTTTGDYRFLSGGIFDNQLVLTCFDGAHAFRFDATANEDGSLSGDFRSSGTWHETWTATRDDDAQLPSAFQQTTVADRDALNQLSFPDLDGVERRLNDEEFAGKARLIYVFGSWCPNCHDAAAYFKELESKYGDRGMSILGLAFELTSDQQRNADQVRRYIERHEIAYPVLIAGPADKTEATKSFPVLDRVRSYPTTIFVDRTGTIRQIYTGFSGPATGQSYEELKQQFESTIEKMLDE